jgi:hypothetical protein
MRLKLASGDIDLYFCIWIGVAEGLFIFFSRSIDLSRSPCHLAKASG